MGKQIRDLMGDIVNLKRQRAAANLTIQLPEMKDPESRDNSPQTPPSPETYDLLDTRPEVNQILQARTNNGWSEAKVTKIYQQEKWNKEIQTLYDIQLKGSDVKHE